MIHETTIIPRFWIPVPRAVIRFSFHHHLIPLDVILGMISIDVRMSCQIVRKISVAIPLSQWDTDRGPLKPPGL